MLSTSFLLNSCFHHDLQVDGIAQQQNGSHRVLHPLTHANDGIPSQSSSRTDPYLPRPRNPPIKKSKIPCVLGRNAFLSVPGPGPPFIRAASPCNLPRPWFLTSLARLGGNPRQDVSWPRRARTLCHTSAPFQILFLRPRDATDTTEVAGMDQPFLIGENVKKVFML